MSDLTAIFQQAAGKVLVPARESSRTLSIETFARELPPGSRLFTLRCDFEEGGPWAGMRDLFREVLPEPGSGDADLLVKHDYELVHVLPDLKPTLGVRNPNLTDLASSEERVRNYPADRAVRIVHGMIELLIELKERTETTARATCATCATWILLCVDYDRAGHITQVFFRELMRRAGARLHLLLVPMISGSQDAGFAPEVCQELPFAISAPAKAPEPDKAEAGELARALEAQVGDDTLISSGKVADLIRLWTLAERPDKAFQWRFKALSVFNILGLYADSLRYGEPARTQSKTIEHLPAGVRWGLFFKLFMAYLGLNDAEAALRLAEDDIGMDCEGAGEAAVLRIGFCYMMAMLHARYLPARDFAAGERYLELGVTYLSQASLPERDHYFMLAFNRNGLAMIRSFQGYHQEALSLCRDAWQMLDEHLDHRQHRLHRSVLLYNMAQVYNQIGAFDLAIEQYSAAIELDPNYSEYYNDRGNLLLKLGRFEEADRDYHRAIALGPPYFEVWSNLGQCYRMLGRMEEALAAYDRSLDLNPDQPMAWVVRAQALQALERIDAAIDSYSRALSFQPTPWPAFAGRAVLLYEQGRLQECLADLDCAVALAPDEPELYQNRAVANDDLGRRQAASSDLRKYLELQPDAADRAEVEARLAAISPALSAVPA